MEASALIRQARLAAGFTQAELAERTGVRQPEIARLESTGANPRIGTLKRVVAATGQSLTLGLDPTGGVDETMIAENLRMSAGERLRQFEAAYRSVSDLVSHARD
jgi:transcriptional regulator with XRE-family HTH domain